jgi:hypothetical protein
MRTEREPLASSRHEQLAPPQRVAEGGLLKEAVAGAIATFRQELAFGIAELQPCLEAGCTRGTVHPARVFLL